VTVEALGWVFVLCLPALAVAFFAGLLRLRLSSAVALQGLASRLRSHPGAGELREVLRETLSDPSLEVAYAAPGRSGRWLDATGHEVALPRVDPERAVTEVRDGADPVAALVHDPALNDRPGLVETAGFFALAAFENQRLGAQVEASLEELRGSRARIQAAADDERRRIERDLHDGAQQRLVALRVRLELADEAMRDDPARGGALVQELGGEIEEAIEEVRSLAGGIYPPLLAERGLTEALRVAARRGPVPVTVEAEGIGRYPEEVESAVYFCCLEALQNAAKHARGAGAASIRLAEQDGALRFVVRDDGAGFAVHAVPGGRGLTNMRDRLAAVRGELTIESAPGRGAVVAGSVPAERKA
ncbi:MAG TPA: histidine kinase, partial [Gaiellaceae bacterium]|nr:histidine kinase [Gaiellaceae bacterium]